MFSMTPTPTAAPDVIRVDANTLYRTVFESSQPMARPETPDLLVHELDRPSVLDVAEASFRRETVLGRLFAVHGLADASSPAPGWNPYSYFARSREDYEDLAPYVAQGAFDSAHSERQFKQVAENIRASKRDLQTIQRGGTLGAIAGMGASLLDVTSLMSVGAVGFKLNSASRAINALRGAGAVAADAAIQEVALQNLDLTRTAEESFMNIGTGAILGAGIGSLVRHAAHPASRLNPEHPENPLRPENFERDHTVIETRPTQTPEEGVVVGGGSVGAAGSRLDPTASEIAHGTGVGGVVQDAFEAVLNHGTPVARMSHYLAAGRDALLGLVDMGGRLTKAMAGGVAHAPEAESLKLVYQQRARNAAEDIAGILRDANLDVGQSRLGTYAKGAVNVLSLGKLDNNRVPKDLFNRAVTNRLSATMLEGHGFSGQRFRAEREVKEELKANGFSDEEVDLVWARVEQAAKRTTELFDEFAADAVKTGLMDADTVKKGTYGMPVLYIKRAIDDNPREFENALWKLLSERPSDEFLQAEFGKTWDDLQADPALVSQAMAAWRGDVENTAAAVAANNLAESARRLENAKAEYRTIAQGLGFAEKELKARSVSAIKAQARAAEINRHALGMGYALRRAEKAAARIEELRKNYPDILDFADDIGDQFAKTGHALDDLIAERLAPQTKAKTEADALVAAVRGDVKEAKKTASAQEIADLKAKLADALDERKAANAALAESRAALTRAAQEQRNANKWLDAVARRIEQNKGDLNESLDAPGIKRALEDAKARAQTLKDIAHEADQARRAYANAVREVRRGRAVSRAEVKEFMRDWSKAKRLKKRQEGATPLAEYIEGVMQSMRGSDRWRGGMLMDDVAETGRVKARTFQWTPDLWKELVDRGYVETDVLQLMDRYQNDLGGRLALQKSVGSQDVSKVLKQVQSEYDAAIDAAKAKGDTKEAERLRRLRGKNLEDIRASWERVVFGRRLTQDDEHAVPWLAEKLSQLNFIRFAGGFVLSAVGDIATAMFSTPGFIRGVKSQHRMYAEILKRAHEGDPDFKELKAILASMEGGAHLAVSVNALGGGTSRHHLGFGDGAVRATTSAIDRGMNMVSDRVNVLSGLAAYSDNIRRVAGLVQLKNIARDVGRFRSLSKADQAHFASLGIGQDEADQLAALFKKHGKQEGELFNPGVSKWAAEENGDRMLDVLNAALVKTQNRASYTKGYGTVPLMMDKWYGKLLFQFQSQVFQFTNNFMLAGIQRGAVSGDWMRFAHVLGTSIAAGILVSSVRGYLRGDDPSEWSNAKWASEIVNRSGVLGWSQPYADAGLKLFGGAINNVLGFSALEPSSKYRQNSALESFLGPWAGTLRLVSESTGDAARGDFTQAGEKAMRLAPLNQQLQLLNFIADHLDP